MGTIASFHREVMRTAFFWAITLKMGPIRFPETSVSSYSLCVVVQNSVVLNNMGFILLKTSVD
jgi:hypothetical protein